MFEFLCRKLGWEPKQGESHLDALLRGEILTALAVFGHDLTLNEAIRRFHAFLDDRNTSLLPPDIRKVGKVNIGQFLVFLHFQFQWMFMDWVCRQHTWV
jgi:puromycin-sensitive aminopeptidase